MTTRLELLPDVYLTAVQTSRFKTACFSLSFLRPLRQEEAGMNALLPSVLLRGSESAPSIRAIADRLDALCGVLYLLLFQMGCKGFVLLLCRL